MTFAVPVFARVPAVIDIVLETARWLGRQHGDAELTLLIKLNRLGGMSEDDFCAAVQRQLGGALALERLTTPESSVAGAWNEFVAWAAAHEHDHLVLLNQDALLEADALAALLAFSDEASDDVLVASAVDIKAHPLPRAGTVTDSPDFSCCMVAPRAFAAAFGRFDENFSPAYFEDNDAHSRIVLAGRRAVQVHAARFYHLRSSVVRSDAAAANACHALFARNFEYFRRKWGHAPVDVPEEMKRAYYARPFNDARFGIHDWPEPSERPLL